MKYDLWRTYRTCALLHRLAIFRGGTPADHVLVRDPVPQLIEAVRHLSEEGTLDEKRKTAR